MDIKNVKFYGLEESLIRSGYPMQIEEPDDLDDVFSFGRIQLSNYLYRYGNKPNSVIRANKLAKTPIGSGHDNFLKGIIVQFDLKYPQYFTSQLQRYNFIDIISSQSKMHSLTKIKDVEAHCNNYVLWTIVDKINELIAAYNFDSYPIILEERIGIDNIDTQVIATNKQQMYQYIISNLPMGFELWMGISTNYLQLKTIYNQRKNHKLEEWKYFCNWIKTLPMSNELIIT